MSQYCIDREGGHEVHNKSCHYLPAPWNYIEFEADSDYDAIRKARQDYPDAFECFFCMPDSLSKKNSG